MKTLEELRKDLAELVGSLDGLEAKANAEAATEDDVTAYDKALDDVDALEKDIDRAERKAAIVARSAKPATEPAQRAVEELGADPVEPVQRNKAVDANEKLGAFLLGAVKTHKLRQVGRDAVAANMNELGYGQVADEFKLAEKTMTTVVDAEGGYLAPDQWNDDIIPLLYERSTFMQGGPRTIDMPRGNFNQPKGLAGVTAAYGAEASDIAVDQPTLQPINMQAQRLGVIVPASNQLLRYSLGAAMAFIREDMNMAMSTKMDETAYLGTGIAPVPLGILNAAGIYSAPASGAASPTVAQIDADTRLMKARLTRYPVLANGVHWVMTPRVYDWMQDIRHSDGDYAYPELRGDSPTFKGYPVLVTGTVPENGGASTDEATIALVSFGSVLMGVAYGLSIKVSDEATIMPTGPTGDPVSAFSTDSTFVRATMEHDFTTRYAEAVNQLSAVRWGA